MIAKTVWKEKMQLTGQSGKHSIDLDTKPPLGNDTGLTPKELVAIGVCGCTAMDVVALLKKYKEPLEAFEVSVDVTSTEKIEPAVFKSLALTFDLKGTLNKENVLKAITLSQTKYCGVSAMILKAAPISYKVVLNGEEIGTGEAKF